MALRKALHASLEGVAEGETVIVACSGGPDSLALAATLAWAAPRHRLNAVAIVIDHGLQEDSARVAREAAERCTALGLPARVLRVEVGTDGGPEMAARTARYAALEQAARDIGYFQESLPDRQRDIILDIFIFRFTFIVFCIDAKFACTGVRRVTTIRLQG